MNCHQFRRKKRIREILSEEEKTKHKFNLTFNFKANCCLSLYFSNVTILRKQENKYQFVQTCQNLSRMTTFRIPKLWPFLTSGRCSELQLCYASYLKLYPKIVVASIKMFISKFFFVFIKLYLSVVEMYTYCLVKQLLYLVFQ